MATSEKQKAAYARWYARHKEAARRAMREGIGMDEARRRIAEEDERKGLQYKDLIKYHPDEVRGG